MDRAVNAGRSAQSSYKTHPIPQQSARVVYGALLSHTSGAMYMGVPTPGVAVDLSAACCVGPTPDAEASSTLATPKSPNFRNPVFVKKRLAVLTSLWTCKAWHRERHVAHHVSHTV